MRLAVSVGSLVKRRALQGCHAQFRENLLLPDALFERSQRDVWAVPRQVAVRPEAGLRRYSSWGEISKIPNACTAEPQTYCHITSVRPPKAKCAAIFRLAIASTRRGTLIDTGLRLYQRII